MKILRFCSPSTGNPVIGVLSDDKVFDINQSFSQSQSTIKQVRVKSVNELLVMLPQLNDEVQKAISFANQQADGEGTLYFNLSEVTLLSPLDYVPKIIALAGNYRTHGPGEKPKRPLLFSKNTGIGIVSPNQDIVVPDTIDHLDYEIELGIVIGKKGRFIPLEHAPDHIGGYTVFNDICDRLFLYERAAIGPDWYGMKAQENFSVFGPYIQTAVSDPQELDIQLSVNGELRQDGNTRDMLFTATELVQYISQLITLESGDIIATGTCFGTAMERARQDEDCWLQDGDVIDAKIEQIGVLSNRIHRIKPTYQK
jgi:2-keto-4-pentenoate hydratase/2-oxohepta-3-ene-1,7-dioic acid hydratase in catechol pathway